VKARGDRARGLWSSGWRAGLHHAAAHQLEDHTHDSGRRPTGAVV